MVQYFRELTSFTYKIVMTELVTRSRKWFCVMIFRDVNTGSGGWVISTWSFLWSYISGKWVKLFQHHYQSNSQRDDVIINILLYVQAVIRSYFLGQLITIFFKPIHECSYYKSHRLLHLHQSVSLKRDINMNDCQSLVLSLVKQILNILKFISY